MLRRWILSIAFPLLLLAPATSLAAEETPAAPVYKAKIIDVRTTYGPESWKSNTTFYRYGPVNGFNNYSSQFGNALGYRLQITIRLLDEAGAEVAPAADTGQVMPSAYIPLGRGRLDAYVERHLTNPGACPGAPIGSDAGCQNPVYRLHFDIDGSSFDPDGPGPYRPILPLPPGLKTVNIDFVRRGALPTTAPEPAGSDQLFFNVVSPQQTLNIPRVLPASISSIPDTALRLLNDIGNGNRVAFVHEPILPETDLNVSYNFGVPGATVELHALTANRYCNPASNCVPDGSTKVHRNRIASGRTLSDGTVTFPINATNLLAYSTRSFNAALVVVAAHLKPEADLNGTYPVKGGFGLNAGAIEAVLPITRHRAQVAAFEIDTRLQENFSNPQAPGALSNAAGSVNRLTVVSIDEDNVACSDCGDALAYVPDRDGLLGRAQINPDPDPTLRRWRANLPVDSPPGAGIRSAHVTSYRVLELFYCPASSTTSPCNGESRADEFHSLAMADRGFRLELGSTPRANVNSQGGVWINITSLNTNYDRRGEEKPFELRILGRIQSAPAKLDRFETWVVPEGQVLQRYFPVSAANGTGLYVVRVQATTGDTLSDTLQTTIDFYEAPPAKRLGGLPGFEAFLLAAAVAAALVVLRRKQAF